MIDLMPLVEAVASIGMLAVLGVIPVVLPAVLKRLRISNESDLAKRIEVAAMAGAGAAYKYALERAAAGGLGNVVVKHDALAAGVNHVAQSLPDTLEAMGIGREHIQRMVEARLGELLARDPSVSALAAEHPTAA
jgi:hypothetical protein